MLQTISYGTFPLINIVTSFNKMKNLKISFFACIIISQVVYHCQIVPLIGCLDGYSTSYVTLSQMLKKISRVHSISYADIQNVLQFAIITCLSAALFHTTSVRDILQCLWQGTLLSTQQMVLFV
ncbi:hypothetical protein HJG60_010126 [Phyllostomus discolor]|uniref:Uncharacterized protein n=1 Tax=Phyllostomus discolor TaxID=89673 RepID=A0A834EK03_9CHIR|nr:hypothetical protein HJG60_010126 [Phyllostomus discolor]